MKIIKTELKQMEAKSRSLKTLIKTTQKSGNYAGCYQSDLIYLKKEIRNFNIAYRILKMTYFLNCSYELLSLKEGKYTMLYLSYGDKTILLEKSIYQAYTFGYNNKINEKYNELKLSLQKSEKERECLKCIA